MPWHQSVLAPSESWREFWCSQTNCAPQVDDEEDNAGKEEVVDRPLQKTRQRLHDKLADKIMTGPLYSLLPTLHAYLVRGGFVSCLPSCLGFGLGFGLGCTFQPVTVPS